MVAKLVLLCTAREFIVTKLILLSLAFAVMAQVHAGIDASWRVYRHSLSEWNETSSSLNSRFLVGVMTIALLLFLMAQLFVGHALLSLWLVVNKKFWI